MQLNKCVGTSQRHGSTLYPSMLFRFVTRLVCNINPRFRIFSIPFLLTLPDTEHMVTFSNGRTLQSHIFPSEFDTIL